MLETLLLLAAGAFVGWNFPQPFWAVAAQKWAVAKWEAFKHK
jgi:hypothetical protein